MSDRLRWIIAAQLAEMRDVLNNADPEQFKTASQLIANAPTVHLTGRGRNVLALRAFGNRLMQLGKRVSILGDILASRVSDGDVVVIASGSGGTRALLEVATSAHSLHATTLAIAGRADSPLVRAANSRLMIPTLSTGTSSQPLGTLFEQCLGIMCDALVIDLMARLDVSVEMMRARHANIE